MAEQQPSKLAIHSVPRSGSSWLGEIINSHPNVSYHFQPLFSYAFKSFLDDNSSAEDVRSFFEQIILSEEEFLSQKKERDLGTKPTFMKAGRPSLVAYKEVRYHFVLENALRVVPEFKCVGLIRCPLAVLSSFKNAPREFRADLGWNFEKEWRFAQSKNENRREDYFGYEKWKEAALLFLRLEREFPDRVLIINYNELIENTLQQVERLFDFCELDLHSQSTRFLERADDPGRNTNRAGQLGSVYSVFNSRSKDLDWQGVLSDCIVNYITNDLKSSPLSSFLSVACR